MSVHRILFAFTFFAIAMSMTGSVSAQHRFVDHSSSYTASSDYCEDCGGDYYGDWGDSAGHGGWLGLLGGGESLWKIRAGALALYRGKLEAKPLLSLDDGFQVRDAVSGSEFDTGFGGGGEVSIERKLHCDYAWEVRYFETEEMDDRISLRDRFGWGYQIDGNNNFGLFAATETVSGLFDFENSIRSGEANLKAYFGRVSILAGLRYVRLEEFIALSLLDSDTGDTSVTFYDTKNEMYGFQVGLETPLTPKHCALQVRGYGKVGVYYNDLTSRNGFDSNVAASSRSAINDDQSASVAELGLTGTYDLTYCLSLQVGVQALWLNSVALATDQPARNGSPTTDGITFLDSSGTAYYTGIFAGIQFVH